MQPCHCAPRKWRERLHGSEREECRHIHGCFALGRSVTPNTRPAVAHVSLGLPGGTRSGSVDPVLIFHHTRDAGQMVEQGSGLVSKAELILNKCAASPRRSTLCCADNFSDKAVCKRLCGTSDFGQILSRLDATPRDDAAELAYALFAGPRAQLRRLVYAQIAGRGPRRAGRRVGVFWRHWRAQHASASTRWWHICVHLAARSTTRGTMAVRRTVGASARFRATRRRSGYLCARRCARYSQQACSLLTQLSRTGRGVTMRQDGSRVDELAEVDQVSSYFSDCGHPWTSLKQC